MAKGFAGTVFLTTDDCQASYEELKGRGVEFTEAPEERPYGIDSGFRDPSGNHFRLTQVARSRTSEPALPPRPLAGAAGLSSRACTMDRPRSRSRPSGTCSARSTRSGRARRSRRSRTRRSTTRGSRRPTRG